MTVEIIDQNTERLILGSVLLNAGAAMNGLRSTMEPGDFGLHRHRQIWQASCDIYDAFGKLDRVMVAAELQKRGQLGHDGMSYVVGLDDGLPDVPCLDRYIEVLKDKALLRRIYAVTDNLRQRAMSGQETGDELREAMGKALAEMETGDMERRPISTREMLEKIGIDELLDPQKIEGVRLPWNRLNTALHGMRGGQIIIVAADTGRGKTSSALQMTTHAAKQGVSTLYWTMEMPPKALFRRMITQMTGVDRRNAAPTFQEREKERTAVSLIYDTPVYFDAHSRTVAGFASSIRMVRQKTRLGLVVVDYLQLIRAAGRAESRTREVGENSRSLKLASMDFDLPFLVLSQFSRPKESGRPTIHSLKESGDVENDADVILLFISEELAPTGLTPVAVNIGKQREGVSGFDVPLMFNPQSQSFQSAEDTLGES